MMKNSMRFVAICAMAALFALSLLSSELKADQKAESFDNSRIKLIKSLSFPNDVMNFVPTIPADGGKIGLILTKGGVYELKKDLSETFLMEGFNRSKDGGEDYIISASPTGEFVFQYVIESELGILDLNAKTKKALRLYGEPIISESSVFVANGMTRKSEIIDFKGNTINELSGGDSGLLPKAYNAGFIANGRDLIFYDKNGNIIKKIEGNANANFDVSYNTGTTVTVFPAKNQAADNSGSLVSFYSKEGNRQHQLSAYCNGASGVAISKNGKYSVVSCIPSNEILFIDVASGKLLWKKTMELGDYFTNWKHPIPISSDGNFFVVYGKLNATDTDVCSFVLIDSKGDIMGFIDQKAPHVIDNHLIFDPDHPRIFHCYDKHLDVYDIEEYRGNNK